MVSALVTAANNLYRKNGGNDNLKSFDMTFQQVPAEQARAKFSRIQALKVKLECHNNPIFLFVAIHISLHSCGYKI